MSDETDLGDLTPQRRRYVIGGKKYVLTEASERARVAHQNRRQARARYNPDTGRFAGYDASLSDLEPALVADCLFEVDAKGEIAASVPEEVIRSWPSRVVVPLFDAVKRMSPHLEDMPETVEDIDAQIQRLRDWRKKVAGEDPKAPAVATGGTSA